MVAAYEGEIAALDRVLGRLLEALLTEERPTIVLVTSDHGEEFYEHGGWGHGHSLHEELLRVPCIVAGSGIPEGRLVSGDARLVDVAPTLLELAGIAPGASMVGRSWAEAIRQRAEAFRGEAFSEIIYNDTYWARSLRSGVWKLLRGRFGEEESTQLYELASDPREARDRAADDPAMTEALSERLEEIVEAARRGAIAPETADFDPLTVERLRALGYVQ
jgi:arylsulfatase A-like enzyme